MLLIAPILLLWSILLRSPRLRCLLTEQRELSRSEENLCVLAAGLSRKLAVVSFLLWAARGFAGVWPYVAAGILSAAAVASFLWKAATG